MRVSREWRIAGEQGKRTTPGSVQPMPPFAKKFGQHHRPAGQGGSGKRQQRQPTPGTADRLGQSRQIPLATAANHRSAVDLLPTIWTGSQGHGITLNRPPDVVKPECVTPPPPGFAPPGQTTMPPLLRAGAKDLFLLVIIRGSRYNRREQFLTVNHELEQRYRLTRLEKSADKGESNDQ